MLFHCCFGPLKAIQAVVIAEDVLEQLVPFDFSIIADRVHQLHFFAGLGRSDDGGRDELNFIRLEVKGKIESHVSWLVTQDSNTDLIFDDFGCVFIEIQQLHAKRTGTETA